MTGRAYVPLARDGLARLADGTLGPAPLEAYAATPALRRWYGEPETGEEELEAVAAALAAQASLALLGPDEEVRLVAAVDAAWTEDELDQPGRVRIEAPVPLSDVASVLADTAEAADDVRTVVRLLAAQDDTKDDTEDEGLDRALDRVERYPLAWFSPAEVPVLLAGLGGRGSR